ncbi:MAG: hypothetical protein ABR505_00830 [Actinomycetota bacterium]
MLVRFLLCASFALTACDGTVDQGRSSPSPTATAIPSESEAEARRFDGLTITLEVEQARVRSGREIGSFVDIRNDSGEAITDPRCLIASTRSGLIPANDPDAELWQQVIVDCAGPFIYEEGFIDRRTGPTFVARDKFGDPLPPGDYLAALEIPGYSQRLTQPVEVTD